MTVYESQMHVAVRSLRTARLSVRWPGRPRSPCQGRANHVGRYLPGTSRRFARAAGEASRLRSSKKIGTLQPRRPTAVRHSSGTRQGEGQRTGRWTRTVSVRPARGRNGEWYRSTKGPLSILHVSLAPDKTRAQRPHVPRHGQYTGLTAGDPQTDPLRRTRVSCPQPHAPPRSSSSRQITTAGSVPAPRHRHAND